MRAIRFPPTFARAPSWGSSYKSDSRMSRDLFVSTVTPG